jgi:hypothetical protein
MIAPAADGCKRGLDGAWMLDCLVGEHDQYANRVRGMFHNCTTVQIAHGRLASLLKRLDSLVSSIGPSGPELPKHWSDHSGCVSIFENGCRLDGEKL